MPFDPIVVVDNGSGDGSYELLEHRLSGCTLLRREQNAGFSAGVNDGVRVALEAGADRVLLLNSDALLAADAAEKLIGRARRRFRGGHRGADDPRRDAAGQIASRGISFSPDRGACG